MLNLTNLFCIFHSTVFLVFQTPPPQCSTFSHSYLKECCTKVLYTQCSLLYVLYWICYYNVHCCMYWICYYWHLNMQQFRCSYKLYFNSIDRQVIIITLLFLTILLLVFLCIYVWHIWLCCVFADEVINWLRINLVR